MSRALAFAAHDSKGPLRPFSFDRRDVGPRDVRIDITFCGVCHSDLHTARGEWAGTAYPCVPGHEIIGRVAEVGREVTKFRVGQTAAVGCMVGSCGACKSCEAGLEQYCTGASGTVFTYNSRDARSPQPNGITYGGYSNHIVVDQGFCLRVPENLDPAAAAPLLCAGITLYSPLAYWGAGKGKKVGIVGLGGLGHMGVKLSHALGAETVLFTTSASKAADGARLGADHVVVSTDPAAMKKHEASLDLIVDTASVSHDLDAYLGMLRRDGALVLVGVPEHAHPSPSVGKLIMGRRSLSGSLIGGIKETQEMLDFCGARGVVSDIETIPIQKIDEAYGRMLKSDVRYRFVIDIASLNRT
jgi:uncharacterized zinc-type alcohol dehydrogenase-like protein